MKRLKGALKTFRSNLLLELFAKWPSLITKVAFTFQVLKKFGDVVWHVSWSVTGNILAVSGGDNKVNLT